MPNEITGIQKGAIIKAQDIYDRYHGIIDSLLQKAQSNAAELSSKISTFKNNLVGDSRPAWSALEASSYTEVSNKISNIITNLKSLETQWYGEDNSNSAHGGIQEYDSQYTDHQSRILYPLHVIKNDRSNRYAADGRVNQSDFIGAYHFKSTIESLYAIATSLRDIYVKFSDSSTTTDISVTKTPFSDIALTRPSAVDNYITDSSISVDSESPLSVHIVPFHDWILNTNANGCKMGVFDETSVYEHGWTSSSIDTHRYPDALVDKINSLYLINRNPNGRQIVRNLTSTSKGEQSKLSNFYSNDTQQYGFGQYPSAGISKEFYSMKYGTDISSEDGNIKISITSTPSIDLNDYFYKNIQESRDPQITDTIHNNVIRSKTLGNNHIVYAQTVNDMFKRLNIMLVQISSSLYGRYTYRHENGHIVNYGSGNPLGGLAYPEMLSWYSGGTSGGTINFLNRGNPIGGQADHTETYSGSLRNDSYVANEADNTWQSIKCGYPWIKNNPITSIAEIYDNYKGSTVPMSFNAGVENPAGTSNSVKVDNLTKGDYGYGTSSSGKYTIRASKQTSANSQVFTRYCISHPVELSVEQRITSDTPAGGGSPIYPSSDPSISSFKNLDINSKYLFMPYMTYLDSWYSATVNNIYVGKFLGQTENINKRSNIFESIGMPVQMKNRNQIWNSNEILSNYNDINVGLRLKKYDAGSSFTYFADNKFNLDIIEYIIKGIITVNEVNHTHPGSSVLDLYVEDNSVFNITLKYNEVTNVTGTVRGTVGDVTSTVYYGKNEYTIQSNQNISSFYKDALDAIMFDRYKFNDFYYDYEPLRFVDAIDAVAPYFSCGEDNLYLGGNWTTFWNWNIKKRLSSGSKQFQLYPRFNNVAGSDGKNMIQGNFYFSANHSNKISCSYTIPKSQQTVNLGYCDYMYIPVPNPVSVTKVSIDTYESINNIEVSGLCDAWWNNLEQIQIGMNIYTEESSEPSNILFHANLVPDIDYNLDYPVYTEDPKTNRRSFNASKVLSSSSLTGYNISATSTWNSSSKSFEFKISCSYTFPETISALNVSYIFSNEDGGKREFLNKPYTISPPSDTIVWYDNDAISSYSISGTFLSDSIVNKENAVKIKIGTAVENIGTIAFHNCTELTNIIIPNTIISVGDNAFFNCSSLSSIEIPNSVRKIGFRTFMNCSTLTSIVIGSGINTIHTGAFSSCPALSSITCLATSAPTVDANTFGISDSYYTGWNTHSSGNNVLKVPQGATGYETAGTAWKDTLLDSSKCGFHIEYES